MTPNEARTLAKRCSRSIVAEVVKYLVSQHRPAKSTEDTWDNRLAEIIEAIESSVNALAEQLTAKEKT